MSVKARKSEQSKSLPNSQNTTYIAVIVAVAILGAVAFILLSNADTPSGSNFDYAEIPQSRLADGGFVLGDPEAPVTIVEFADFLCPHCQAYESTMEQFVEEFVVTGQAKFEYRMYPTQGPNAVFAAQLAECAAEQTDNGFWRAHDELYNIASSRSFNESSGRTVAERLGLNYADLLQCTRNAEQVYTDTEVGRRAGVTGTPAVRVRYGDGNIQIISGFERGGPPIEVLRGVVISGASTN